jgi:uncharacterized repeat protein (TIGR01451 family)
VKVNCRWSGTGLVRVRVLCAGVLMLAAGCMTLLWGSRPRQSAQDVPVMSSGPWISGQSNSAGALAVVQSSNRQKVASFSHLPLMFEPNVGQSNSAVKFLARGAGYSLSLTPEGAVVALRRGRKATRTETLGMKLVGANRNVGLHGAAPLPGKSNYFIGGDATKWLRNVPQFSRVEYAAVYPGIDLVFYGNQGQLEYDFKVAPGADPSQAELEFDGSHPIELRDGNLVLKGEDGSVRFEAPSIYQEVNGRRVTVEGRFELRASNRVGFEIGRYDRSRELVIDPVLTYSSFFGGSGNDTSPSIAVDNVQNIYLAGLTTSPANSFPQPAASTTQIGTNANVFVAKLDPSGLSVLYLTFLGGGGVDTAVGLAVDGAGNAYVAGTTTSGVGGTADFPTTTTNAYQSAPATGSAGTSHVFVSALNATGAALNYSSYLSGNGTDVASGMAIDSKSNVYVTGTTTSTDVGSNSDQFPASAPPQAQPFQGFPRAPIQFFVTQVNTAASNIGSIAYSTYFGGGTPSNGVAVGGGVAVDGTGNIYFTGTTSFTYTGTSSSTDFPILNAYQPCLDEAPPTTVVNPPTCANTGATTATDGFVAKLNPKAAAGSQLLWSTYLGGTQTDSATGIALDAGAADIYVTGATNSQDFTALTTFTSYQPCLNNLFTVASSVTTCTVQTDPAVNDAFVARLNNPTSGNNALTYFSYLGGSGSEGGSAITVDTAADAILTGFTQSVDFPITTGAIQSTLKGTQDAFYARINTGAVSGQNTVGSYATYFGGSGVDRGTGIVLDTSLNTYFAGDTTSTDLQTASPLQAQNNGGTDAFTVKLGTAADLGITGKLSLGTGQQYVTAGNQATFTYTVTNNGPDLATNITVTDDLSTSTGVPITFVSATASSGSCSQTSAGSTVVCSISSLQSGSTATVTIVVTPTSGGNFNGGAVQVDSTNNNDPQTGNNKVTVAGQASDFTVDVNPKNQSISAAGVTAVYSVTLTPVPVFGSAISLSLSGLPTATSDTFSPSSSVTLSTSSPQTVTLNVTTTARPVTVANSKPGRGPLFAFWLVVPGMALLGAGFGRDRRRRQIVGMVALFALFGLLALQPACSGSSTPPVVSGTPAGTYTLTVTATSGTLSHNVPITLTVP